VWCSVELALGATDPPRLSTGRAQPTNTRSDAFCRSTAPQRGFHAHCRTQRSHEESPALARPTVEPGQAPGAPVKVHRTTNPRRLRLVRLRLVGEARNTRRDQRHLCCPHTHFANPLDRPRQGTRPHRSASRSTSDARGVSGQANRACLASLCSRLVVTSTRRSLDSQA